jgi:hypothetical protein
MTAGRARNAVLALGVWVALIGVNALPRHQEPPAPPPPSAPTQPYVMLPAPTPPPPPPGADETQCLPEYVPKSCVPLHGPIPGTTGWGEWLV